MNEQGIVKESLGEIFKKNGFSNLDRLTQRDFEHISQEIERVTGILISGITIKRLLGGNFSRLPQVATLDAISKYLGYKSWQDYKSAIAVRQEVGTHIPPSLPAINRKPRYLAIPAAVIAIILIVAFIQYNKTNSNFDKAAFSMRKTTADDIPNTVIFNYNIDDVKADSFFIQQSWDKTKRSGFIKTNTRLPISTLSRVIILPNSLQMIR